MSTERQTVDVGGTVAVGSNDELSRQLVASFGGDREALVLAEAYLAAEPQRSAANYLVRVDEIIAARDPEIDRGRFFPAFWISLEAAEAVHESAGAVLAFAAIAPAGEVPIAAYLQPIECYPAELQPVAADPTLFADVLSILGRLRLIEMRSGGTAFVLAGQTRLALLDLLGDARPTWQAISDSVWARMATAEPVDRRDESHLNGRSAGESTAETADDSLDEPLPTEPSPLDGRFLSPPEARAAMIGDQPSAASAGSLPAAAEASRIEAEILILPVDSANADAARDDLDREPGIASERIVESRPVAVAEPPRLSVPQVGDPSGRKTSAGLQARLDTLRQLAGSNADGGPRQEAAAVISDDKDDLLQRRNSFVARLLGRR